MKFLLLIGKKTVDIFEGLENLIHTRSIEKKSDRKKFVQMD